MGVEVVEPIVGLVQERIELREARLEPLLADREQLCLGSVDRLLDLCGILVPDAGDPAGRSDQVAQHGLAFDDPGVLDGMNRRRGRVRET
jgi:hypothetical protein